MERLRNPWRYPFDRANGDLWIGDVRQDSHEEVDLHVAGFPREPNDGWNRTEGSHPMRAADAPANWTRPLFDEAHDGGICAIVGGFVYRGSAVRALRGAYVFTDACDGELLAVRQADGGSSSGWTWACMSAARRRSAKTGAASSTS